MERDVIDQGGQDRFKVLTGDEADAIWPDAVRVVDHMPLHASHYSVTTPDGREIEIINGLVYDPTDDIGNQIGAPLE